MKISYCDPTNWHEWSNLFPLLPPEELRGLSHDIRTHGLQNDIVLLDGKVLDGRNRLLACRMADVEARFREFKPNGISPLAWVISQNLHRRQLTSSQKAIVALEAEPMFAKELKQNQRMGKQKIADPRLKGQARDKAAQLAGVNRQYVSDAKRIQARAPELISEIKAGTLTIVEAQSRPATAIVVASRSPAIDPTGCFAPQDQRCSCLQLQAKIFIYAALGGSAWLSPDACLSHVVHVFAANKLAIQQSRSRVCRLHKQRWISAGDFPIADNLLLVLVFSNGF